MRSSRLASAGVVAKTTRSGGPQFVSSGLDCRRRFARHDGAALFGCTCFSAYGACVRVRFMRKILGVGVGHDWRRLWPRRADKTKTKGTRQGGYIFFLLLDSPDKGCTQGAVQVVEKKDTRLCGNFTRKKKGLGDENKGRVDGAKIRKGLREESCF